MDSWNPTRFAEIVKLFVLDSLLNIFSFFFPFTPFKIPYRMMHGTVNRCTGIVFSLQLNSPVLSVLCLPSPLPSLSLVVSL